MLDVRDRPRFTSERASQVANQLYGIVADARELPSERDQNFMLLRGGKPTAVLKIANSKEDRQVLALQNEALGFVEQQDPTLMVPRVLPALDGADVTTVVGDGEHEYMVRLYSYLPGVPLAEAAPYTPGLIRAVGRFLGRLDRALLGFSHPAADRPLLWNLATVEPVIIQNLDYIPDPARRSAVAGYLANFQRHTRPHLSQIRHAVIHNDANDYNVLVHQFGAGKQVVAGLLDFGDMIRSPLVFEVAVAAAYVMQNADEPLDAAATLVAGYHDCLSLARQEVETLLDLITIRLCTTVVLAAKQSALEPGKPYLLISQEGAWRILDQLLAMDKAPATTLFLQACDLGPMASSSRKWRRQLVDRRKKAVGPSLSLSYRRPLHIVRGFGQYLFDDSGKAYLDCVNNVAHVGHCHPKVVSAGRKQMAVLNTNTRYLHENLIRYAERICDTLPEPLNVCYFVCSGSEANELAIRLARTYTGEQDMIVVDGAYHGNTTTLIDHSPYKHDGPGGRGAPSHVHKVPMPDPYRGQYSGSDAGPRYAGTVKHTLDAIADAGAGIAGFICEPLLGCGGQIVPPEEYLSTTFKYVRQAGGLCIADEVQVGFGRVGTTFWAFEDRGAVPDIVTLGKPIGNGHPLAAVITTPEVAAAFANGMEYFNTFGGNPVSCAIGLAVLDVIQEEGLQQRALSVGKVLMDGLRELMERHELIGDVRGRGMFLGIELVADRHSKMPAVNEAALLVERMKDRGILLSTDGPDHNVIKIKPPLVMTEGDAKFAVQQLDAVLKGL